MSRALAALAFVVGAALSIDDGSRAKADSDSESIVRTVLPPTEDVDVGRGDQWIYQARDSLTGDTLSDIDVAVVDREAEKIDVRIRATNPNTGLVQVGAATFDSYWRRMPDEISQGAGVQDSWGVRPKLQVGDAWNYNFERLLAGGPIKMGWIGHGEALGVERVDLPNGQTVDALKIEFFERPSVARYHFEMRVVEWFAPEINRYVRRDVETRAEGKIVESTTEVLQDYVRRH